MSQRAQQAKWQLPDLSPQEGKKKTTLEKSLLGNSGQHLGISFQYSLGVEMLFELL